MEFTLGDLRALMEEYESFDDSTPVRFASQPSWPFEYSISSEVYVKEDESGEPEVIYLAEGTQLGYLPEDVREGLGWR